MEAHEYTALDYLKGGLFLVWFIGSIAGIFIAISTAPGLVLSVFGQFFFVIGLIVLFTGIKERNFKPIFLIFILIGFLLIMYGVVLEFCEPDTQDNFKALIPYFGIGIFFVTGILSFANAIVRNAMEKKCTHLVQATCVEIKHRRRQVQTEHGSRPTQHYVYCPVYNYTYNGKLYEACNYFFSLDTNACLGQQYDVYINPEHPKQFKETGESVRMNSTELGIGIIFTIISIIGFVVLLVV